MKRRERTRQLIELGGLVAKAGLIELTDDDRAVIFGILTGAAATLRREDRDKALRRHLSTHGLTPEEYRARYNLKPDYPMVAESYSEQRRAMAKKIGLGNKDRAAKATTSAPAPAPKRTPRSTKSA